MYFNTISGGIFKNDNIINFIFNVYYLNIDEVSCTSKYTGECK